MALTRWDPFQELTTLQNQMSRVFGEALHRDGTDALADGHTFAPPVDVRESDEAIKINAELPGVKRDDIDVRLDGNRLTIRAEKRSVEETEGETYQRMECSYGAFARSFTLPEAIDADGLEARFEDGVLHVTVPKAPESKPRTVKVQ